MRDDGMQGNGKHADVRPEPESPGGPEVEVLRRRILDASRDALFERGYPATTIEEIASRAGVSPGLVTEVIGGTRGALIALLDIAMHGDDSPLTMLERSWTQQLCRESDQRAQMQMLADGVTGVLERVGPIHLILRHAAHSDNEMAVAYTRLHDAERRNMGIIAEWVAARGQLKAGMSIDMAADVLWTVTSADVHHLLRHHREWALDQYRDWLGVTLVASLLPQ